MTARTAQAAACALALLAAPALAATPLETILDLRDEGRFEDALAAAAAAGAKAPNDADLALLQGQLLGYLGRHDAGLAALARAEALAPGYADVHRAQVRLRFYKAAAATPVEDGAMLAFADDATDTDALLRGRLAYRSGLYPEARASFERAVRAEPASAPAWLALGDAAREQGDIAASRLAYETALGLPGATSDAARRLQALSQRHWTWLVALSGSTSRVEGDDPWVEGYASVTRRLPGGRLVGASYETARRYGDTDIHVAGTLTQRFAPKTAGYASFGVTPGADFLPTWRGKVGVEHELQAGTPNIGASVGFAEATLSGYDAGLARALGLGLTQYAAGGATWATLKLTGGLDPEDRLDLGASLRLDHQIDQRNRVYLGLARESDAERGGAIDRDSLFLGYRRELGDHLSLDLSFGYESPDRGSDRQSIAAGITLRLD